MAEIVCVLCNEQIETPYPARLEENKMFMFEILMEQTSFDKELFVGSPICEDCDKTLLNFFNFKSNFMEKEDEFINYMNADSKVDLYDVLVKTYKIKKFANESVTVRVCRICLKATQVEEYKEIKSLESSLAMMVITCLPEFNIKLTNHTYLCTECNTIILQYYHFLSICSKLAESRKRPSSEACDPLAIDIEEPKEKRLKIYERPQYEFELSSSSDKEYNNKEANVQGNELLSESQLLIPVERPRRGRPRKGEVAKHVVQSRQYIKKWQRIVAELEIKSTKTTPTSVQSAVRKDLSLLTSDSIDNYGHVDSYECQICPEVFIAWETLKSHLNDHESNDKNFFCWKCGFVCYNFGALLTHYEGHDMGLFKVVKVKTGVKPSENSSKKFKTGASSVNVLNNLLSVPCDRISKPPGVPKRSLRSRNSTNPPHAPLIPKPKAKSKRKTDTSEPGTRSFECQICPGVFHSIDSLAHHVLFHRKQNPIVCSKCGEQFTMLQDLKKHFRKHGLKDIFKIVYSGESLVPDKEEEQLLSSVVDQQTEERVPSSPPLPPPPPPEDHNSSIPCPTCVHKFKSIEEYMNHQCGLSTSSVPASNESTSTIPCRSCKLKFDTLEEYMNHSCSKELGFSCGHCSRVFYSLDDLDEHNCVTTSTNSGNTKGGGDPEPVRTREEGVSTKISTTDQSLTQPQTDPLFTNTDLDYECEYCLRTFSTVKGLDTHECRGDSENAQPSKPSILPQVKKENVFECPYCMIFFESGFELAQHVCTNAPVPADSDQDASVNPDDDSQDSYVINGFSQVVKTDPENEEFLSSESINEQDKENSQCLFKFEPERKDAGNPLKSKSDGSREKPKQMSKNDKKNLINRIAGIFDVKVVEAGNRKKGQTVIDKYTCMGCNFRGLDEKDLMFHMGYCDKVLQCNYCTYRTTIVQKLEIHSWADHNTIIFVCNSCRFVTSMEENYAAHILTHKKCLSDTHVLNEATDITGDNCRYDIVRDNSQNVKSADVQLCSEPEVDAVSALSTTFPVGLNPLFGFQKFKNGQFCVSETVSEKINNRKKSAARCGMQSELVEVTVSAEQTESSNTEENKCVNSNLSNEDTLSAEQIWPNDFDDDLESSVTFNIPGLIENIVARQILEEKAANDDLKTATGERDPLATKPVWLVESSAINKNSSPAPQETNAIAILENDRVNQNQSELIIPDLIISEPTNIKPHPSIQPCDDADTTIYINLDSDSDNEFVESNEALLSTVTSRAGEAVTISESEASKLIAEGVPVIHESSLVTMQMVSSPIGVSSISDAVGSTKNLPPTSLPDPVMIQDNLPTNSHDSDENATEDLDTTSTSGAIESIKDRIEKEQVADATETNTLQSEAAKESYGENEDSAVVKTKEAEQIDSDTIPIKQITVEITVEAEEASDSDGSSFFVTDNDDSGAEDNEELKTKSTAKKKKDLVEKPFLPVPADDGTISSDDDDADPKRSSTKINVSGNNEKVASKISANIINLSSKPAAEESFVISDDEDSTPKEKEPTGGCNAAAETSKKFLGALHDKVKIVDTAVVREVNDNFPKKSDHNPSGAVTKPKIATYSRNTTTKQMKTLKETPSVAKPIMKQKESSVPVSKSAFVVIHDDEDCRVAAVSDGKGEERSRNDSPSSDVERDFSQGGPGEDSGDDCVFVSEVEGIRQSKSFGSSNFLALPQRKRGRPSKVGPTGPPNSLNLFIAKVKSKIQTEYPELRWGAQKNIIVEAWRNMSAADKFPFKEEARLHRVLFRREHPELIQPRTKRKATIAACITDNTPAAPIEEIILD